jgi:hypothetical protein
MPDGRIDASAVALFEDGCPGSECMHLPRFPLVAQHPVESRHFPSPSVEAPLPVPLVFPRSRVIDRSARRGPDKSSRLDEGDGKCRSGEGLRNRPCAVSR